MFGIITSSSFYHLPRGIFGKITDIFQRIEQLDCDDELKIFLELYNLENLSTYNIHYVSKLRSQNVIRYESGIKTRSNELTRKFQRFHDLDNNYYNGLLKVLNISSKTKDEYLSAQVIGVRTRNILKRQLDLIEQFPFWANTNLQSKADLLNDISLSNMAVDIFLQYGHIGLAYDSLCNSLELITISRVHCGYQDTFDTAHLSTFKQEMEIKYDLPVYNLRMANFLKSIALAKDVLAKKQNFIVRCMDDDEILYMAKCFCQAIELPSRCIINKVNELKNFRTFYQRCNEDYEITIKKTHPIHRVAYSQPTKLIIRNILTGQQSEPTSDVDELLNVWGL